MPAFATASYCFYEEDSEKPNPLALKIRSLSIQQLAQLLAADQIQPEFRKQALIEIGKRALDSSNSFELFEKGAIDATIRCLKTQDDEVLELASRALINISVDELSRDDVYDGGGIPLLVSLLQRPNENIQANALWALINLTNNDANKESVCEVPQAITWLVGLSGGDSHLQAYALKLLANLSESAANHGSMLASSVTVPLLKVLVTSRNMSLMSYALYYFRNLTKTEEGREAVLAAAGLKVFAHLLKTYSSPQVRGPVLLILHTLAHHHQEATLQLLKLGVLQPLMQTVQAGQDAVILLALNLLTTFAADARTHKVLVRVLADGGSSLKPLLALQQPKVPTLLAQLLQTLIPPDWSSTDDQGARAVLDTVLGCLADDEARVRPDVQESILLIFLPMAKLGNEYVMQEHVLAAFVGKASSSDVAVQQRALHLLALLALNPGGRLRMAKIGGLNKLLTILADPDDDPTVLTLALLALQNLLLDAKLRDIVIRTQRLRLGPFLQATEPSVAGAAQRLLQSIKVSLEASVKSKEPLPKASGAATAERRAGPTANRGGSAIIGRPAQPPANAKQPQTAPSGAAAGGEGSPQREPGDDESTTGPSSSSSSSSSEKPEEEEGRSRTRSGSTPLELFRKRSSQLSLSTIAYKVTYEGEVKVARVVIGAPWEELREKIFAKFPAADPAHLVVKYKDPAGDLITLESNEDVEFALALSLDSSRATSSQPALHVHLVPRPPPPHQQQQLARTPATTGARSRASIQDLSQEITVRILGFLASPRDLACASMACKRWSSFLADGQSPLWKSLFQRLHHHQPRQQHGAIAQSGGPSSPSTASTASVSSSPFRLSAFMAPLGAGGGRDPAPSLPAAVAPTARPRRALRGEGQPDGANWKEKLVREQRDSELEAQHFQTMRVMKDHHEPVAGVYMHRSGSYFFSCSFDGTAKVWDTGSQRVVGSTKVHLDIVSAIQATDRHLITGSWDRTVKVWELQGTRVGRCTGILKHSGKVNCLGSAASLLATGASDRLVRLWALQRGECVQALQGHQGEVNSLAFWRGDELLCSGGNRETLVWDLATGTCVATLPGHGGEVNAVQADESRIITGGWDKTVKLWDPRSWLCQHTVKAHTWPVRCLQYDEGSNRLVTGSADKTLKVWDLRMFGECLNMLEGHTDFVTCLSLVGNVLVSGSDDCSVRLWDISA